MTTTESLRLDIEELQKLQSQATRQKVKDILDIQIRKLQTDLVQKKEQEGKGNEESPASKTPAESKKPQKRPHKQINTYGWDQSEKFMKLYVTLNGIHNIPKENITTEYTDRGVQLNIIDFENKDQQLNITTLMEEIIPEDSYHKVKTDMIVVFLKKKTQGKTWAYVTQRQDKKKEKKPPMPSNSDDPQDGLMSMLQGMYDDGDDEMKRTIQKAWFDSRAKNPGML